ncbi:FkbM family methyltransferase [archaeon]|nr:MAG: FkbM family methyltransferase [archaeon]
MSIFGSLSLILFISSIISLLGQFHQAANPYNIGHPGGTRGRAHIHKPRNVYIDLGANNGESISTFMGKASNQGVQIDGSNAVKGGISELIRGFLPDALWHIVAVEANDQHDGTLLTLKDTMLKHPNVSSFSLYNGTAVSDKDGTIEFIWDSARRGDAGSTTMSESYSAVGNRMSIPALDIVTLFRKENIHVDDFVVLKVDIEGAEYNVVRRILLSHLWRMIDKIAVEW